MKRSLPGWTFILFFKILNRVFHSLNANDLITIIDYESVLSFHMFIDSTIMQIDIPQDIVLSHVVRIHLCCWSLTADSHCLGWPGQAIQVIVRCLICQEVESQKYQGHVDYNRSPIFVVQELNLSLKFFAFFYHPSPTRTAPVIVILFLNYYHSHSH